MESPSHYFFMVWKEKGKQDRFAFVKKVRWEKLKYLDSETPKDFMAILPESEDYKFFVSSEMIYTYNKKVSFKRGKTEEARKQLLEIGFTEIECPFGNN